MTLSSAAIDLLQRIYDGAELRVLYIYRQCFVTLNEMLLPCELEKAFQKELDVWDVSNPDNYELIRADFGTYKKPNRTSEWLVREEIEQGEKAIEQLGFLYRFTLTEKARQMLAFGKSHLYQDVDGVETYTPALARVLTQVFFPLLDDTVNKAADFYEQHGNTGEDDAILRDLLSGYFMRRYREVVGKIKKKKQAT